MKGLTQNPKIPFNAFRSKNFLELEFFIFFAHRLKHPHVRFFVAPTFRNAWNLFDEATPKHFLQFHKLQEHKSLAAWMLE